MKKDGPDLKNARIFSLVGILCAGIVLLTGVESARGALAVPQVGMPAAAKVPTCEELWREASAGSAADALGKAKLAAGPAPSAAASGWMSRWTGSWNAAWMATGGALAPMASGLAHPPGGDCCDTNWFERAAETGKSSWEKAWSAGSQPGGADKTWADKFVGAYADAWARDWFERFPWLCARARAKASAKAYANASAFADADARAWAVAAASANVLAQARADTWTSVWTEAGSSAWAAAGAAAAAEAAASARSWAIAAASGNCAMARAGSCADAAAAAYAAAWAAAGSSAYAAAFADAWASASARALARAWAVAIARAEAEAWASAWADAYAEAGAKAWAAVWRARLAEKGRLAEISRWWTMPGVSKPPTIWKLLAAASDQAFASAWDIAWDIAWARRPAFAARFRTAQKQARDEMVSFTTSWVNSWTESWAYAWAEAWARAYALMCSRAAAAACVDCRPCVPTTTVTRARSIGYVITGAGVTAGTIFTVGLSNSSSEPVKVAIPGGTVFQPSSPEYQRMISDADREAEVPAEGSTTLPITGYCLDQGLQPPPAGTLASRTGGDGHLLLARLGGLDPLESLAMWPLTMTAMPRFYRGDDQAGAAVKYQILDPAEAGSAFAPFKRIMDAGNKLYADGKFHTDMPPDKYKTTVIQRAVWTFATRGSAQPHTRETLLNDLRKQVKDTGGSQSEADMQRLVDHLWEDVEATLKASGV